MCVQKSIVCLSCVINLFPFCFCLVHVVISYVFSPRILDVLYYILHHFIFWFNFTCCRFVLFVCTVVSLLLFYWMCLLAFEVVAKMNGLLLPFFYCFVMRVIFHLFCFYFCMFFSSYYSFVSVCQCIVHICAYENILHLFLCFFFLPFFVIGVFNPSWFRGARTFDDNQMGGKLACLAATYF